MTIETRIKDPTVCERAEKLAEQLVGYAEVLSDDIANEIEERDNPGDVTEINDLLAVTGAALEAARTAQTIAITPSLDDLSSNGEEDDDG